MKRIAVVAAVLEGPAHNQTLFNETVAAHKNIVKGRMGLPFDEADMAVVSLTVMGEVDEINALTGKLGSIPHVTVKTAMSSKTIG